MAITTGRYQGTLTTTPAAVLSAAANDVITVSKALITNTSNSTAYTITVYDDVANTGAATGNITYGPVAISPLETKVLPLSAMAALSGGKIWAVASANGVLNLSIAYTKTAQ